MVAQAATLARRDLAVHSTAFIIVIVVIGVVVANLAILIIWLLYRRRRAHNAATPQTVAAAPPIMSVYSDTKRRPGTGTSRARPSSAFSNAVLAEKLGPLMPPPQAHITAAPSFYARPAPPQRTRTSYRSSYDINRSPHLTSAPPRRSNSSRRNILSPASSLRRASRAATPSNMSVADSASVYSTTSAAHEQDAIAALPRVSERWKWRPRSQTPVLVLRNLREGEEDAV